MKNENDNLNAINLMIKKYEGSMEYLEKRQILLDPNMKEDVLKFLFYNESIDFRLQFMLDNSIGLKVKLMLLDYASKELKEELSKNNETNEVILNKLCEEKSDDVKVNVSKNKNIGLKAINRLIKDTNPIIKINAMLNKVKFHNEGCLV